MCVYVLGKWCLAGSEEVHQCRIVAEDESDSDQTKKERNDELRCEGAITRLTGFLKKQIYAVNIKSGRRLKIFP